MAVYNVETGGKSFRSNGDPVILFERHRFSKLTGGKYDGTNPVISNPTRGGYGKFSEQLGKLQDAYALDPVAAVKSASFGGFQIMGSNYELAGYDNITDFYDDMTSTNVDLHMDAFASFVESKGLIDELKAQDWDSFAKGYNGKYYNTKNSPSKGYDQKMKNEYEKYKNNPELINDNDCL